MSPESKDLCARLRIVAGQSVVKPPAIDLEAADRIEALEAELGRALLEAVVGWNVCASVHAKYAKGKDALFSTRQADYLRHHSEAEKALLKRGEP